MHGNESITKDSFLHNVQTSRIPVIEAIIKNGQRFFKLVMICKGTKRVYCNQ